MADKTSSGKQIHSTDAEAQIVGEHKRVPIGDIYPNPWNYNVQPDEMFRKLAQSIRMFGFIEPLIVRTRAAGGWEIVNGEHRWQAAKLLKLSELPVLDLGVVEDAKVKQMCIVLNELEGHPDQLRLAELLRDINITVPVEELELVMPFTNDELGMMIKLEDFGFDRLSFGDVRTPVDSPPKENGEEVFGEQPAESAAAPVDDPEADPPAPQRRLVFLLDSVRANDLLARLRKVSGPTGSIVEALVTCVQAYDGGAT